MASITPSAELPSLILFEKTLMVGGFMGCLTYGLHLATYLTAMRYLYKGLRRDNVRRTLWWAFYMTVLLAMGTVYIGANITDLVSSYIDHRDFKVGPVSGPLAYASTRFSTPLIIMGTNSSLIISIFFADGLLVWRLYVIWQNVWITILPAIMWISGTIIGSVRLALDVHKINTNSILNQAIIVRLGTAYYALSLAQTLLVTTLIVGKLLYLRRQASKVLMDVNHYVSASTILLESAMLYAVFALVLLVVYNKNNPVLNVFQQVIIQIIGISADAIILRVAVGSAWTTDSGDDLATKIVFNSRKGDSDTRVTEGSTLGGRNGEKSSEVHLPSMVFSSRNHGSSTRVMDHESTVGRHGEKSLDIHGEEMV